MEGIFAEMAHLAREIERDLRALDRSATRSNGAHRSAQELAQRLDQLERTVNAIRSDTRTLVARVPDDLAAKLDGLKHELYRGPGLLHQEKGSSSPPQPSWRSDSELAPGEALGRLTRQERRVFDLCFQSGPLTYRQIGESLDISATSAKNLVNRLFHSPAKRRLFAKTAVHGLVRVSISRPAERQILKGRNPSKRRSDPEHAQFPTGSRSVE